MATHCILSRRTQLELSIGFNENGFAQGAGSKPAFRGLFDYKNDFVHINTFL